MPTVLIVDDEEMIRDTLKDILENEGFKTEEARDGKEALNLINKRKYDCVLLDIKMPGMDGMEVLGKIMEIKPGLPVVMITGHGNEETAFEAAKKGAYDFITKPPDLNRLLLTLRNALDKSDLMSETRKLKRKVTKTREIIGGSPAIVNIKNTINKVAPTSARVLITGPNGTGKELVAKWIHEKSKRREYPLIEVNCAAIPPDLIESQLFGHEKGSFTSAIKQHIGKFEQATGGTLFLDEIGDMSMAAQAKVLRSLEEGKILRVGGEKAIDIDVRVVAATNKNLVEKIEKGNFREDLYHRLSVILINVPPLNERTEDIPLLTENFLGEICQEHGIKKKSLDPGALEEFKKINWTGNIRELHNVIERLVILSSNRITREDILSYVQPLGVRQPGISIHPEKFQRLEDYQAFTEKLFLEKKLHRNNGNIGKTAKESGLPEARLKEKIQLYGLNPK